MTNLEVGDKAVSEMNTPIKLEPSGLGVVMKIGNEVSKKNMFISISKNVHSHASCFSSV